MKPAVDASLILSIGIDENLFSASGVAISSKRALTALHGKIPLHTPVDVTTRNGKKMSGKVEFERFEENLVDVAVIKLEATSEFDHYIAHCDEPVKLDQPLKVVGLKYATIGDSVSHYVRRTCVEMIEEFCETSALFQAQYYSLDGCSGTGVVTAVYGKALKVVGVHVASNEDSTLLSPDGKPTKKRSFARFEASIASAIHGHKAYSLVCDIARVPDLMALLNNA